MLEGYKSPFDATVVARLKAAGAVSIGKLNCDEFAMGSANENSAFGPVRNPWDATRVPGGSSGGSAAAVAAQLVPAATGTDTGGSIRQPASFTGVTGIKPTYGVCSRFGMIAFASSLDQAGPLARSAEDCALLLSAMSGFDERDATSVQQPAAGLPRADAPRLARRRHRGAAAQGPAHRPAQGVLPRGARRRRQRPRACEALAEMEKLGATLVGRLAAAHRAVDPRVLHHRPGGGQLQPEPLSTACATATAPKGRWCARSPRRIRPSSSRCTSLSRSEAFGPEVKRRIMIGTYVLSHGYYDAYYLQAQKLRRMIADDFQACFQQCDVIAGPVAPTVAWKLGEQGDDPVKAYLADIFTLPGSLAGLPGMSVPAGLGEGGMPVGLQLLGNYFAEGTLLHAAHALQAATDFHLQRPQAR